MFVIRYINTMVILGIVNGTIRMGRGKILSIAYFIPTGPEGPNKDFFFFLKKFLPDFIQLLKPVFLFF